MKTEPSMEFETGLLWALKPVRIRRSYKELRSHRNLSNALIWFISDAIVSGREITRTLFDLILLDVQSQRAVRGYHPLEFTDEQRNKTVNIICDVFHALYQGVLYYQHIILFLLNHVIILHTCDRLMAQLLICIL